MERIGVEEIRQRIPEMIKRVEAGEEIMLTKYGKDVALVVSPEKEASDMVEAFFVTLDGMKSRAPVKADREELREWIDEGRA